MKKLIRLNPWRNLSLTILFSLTLFCVAKAQSQDSDTTARQYFQKYYQTHKSPTSNIPQVQNSQTGAYWIERQLCYALLVFAFLLCGAEIVLFLRGKVDQVTIIKLIFITLIIFSLLFLITAGYDNAQTQTSVGLLGTIAGYILGKSTTDSASKPQPGPTNNDK